MMKKYLKTLIITSLVILMPILVGLCLWNQLPAQIPIHWNVAGEVDGWGSKSLVVVGMPLILLAGQWFCVLATGLDPKKKNFSPKVMNLVLWIIPVLNFVLTAVTYAAAMGKDLPVEVVMPVCFGVMFVLIGNYLPKCKQSYTVGIKIPWTLDSEENWNKTHRFAGKLWVVCGVLGALTGFLGKYAFVGLMGVTAVMVIVPVVYSYILYKKGI